MQKPKFHGVRRPTHRLISTRAAPSTTRARTRTDDGDHPLEDVGAIGFVVALFLHLLLPEDLEEDEEKPRTSFPRYGLGGDPVAGLRAPACWHAHPASSAQPQGPRSAWKLHPTLTTDPDHLVGITNTLPPGDDVAPAPAPAAAAVRRTWQL